MPLRDFILIFKYNLKVRDMKKYSKIECHNMIVNSKFPIDPFTMYINENFKTVEEMDKIVKEANKFFEV